MRFVIIHVLIISCLSCSTCSLHSQDHAQGAKYEVESTLSYAEEVFYSNEDCIDILTEASIKAKSISDSTYKMRCYQGLCWSYYYDGRYEEMLKFLIRTKSMLHEYGNIEQNLEWLNSMGYYWHEKKFFLESLECQFKSLEYLENYDDSFLYSKVLNSIGIAHTELQFYDSAMYYHRTNLELRNKLGLDRYTGQTLYNIGEIYELTDRYDSAFHYYYRAQKHRAQVNYEQGLAWGYHNIGRSYLNLNILDSAEVNMRKAIDLVVENSDIQSVCYFGIGLGEIQIKQGLIDSGLDNCRRSLDMAIDYTPEERMKACSCLYEGHKANGASDSALIYLQKHGEYKDSLNLVTQAAESTRLIMLGNFESTENAFNSELEARKRLTIQISVGAILILLTLGILAQSMRRKWQREKERNEFIEKLKSEELEKKIAEKEKEKSQSLLKAVENEKDDLAKELHDGFGSRLFGSILRMKLSIQNQDISVLKDTAIELENGYEQLRSISRQLSHISTQGFNNLNEMIEDEIDLYSGISSTEFSFMEKNKVELPNEFIATHALRSVQTLLNNVIRHSKADRCEVQIEIDNEEILIVIQDNGIGIQEVDLENSYGLKNVASRLADLGGRFEIANVLPHGTKASIRFNPVHKLFN